MKSKLFFSLLVALMPLLGIAQTLNDGIFMPKKILCSGIMQQHDRFSEYWEGTTLRSNRNMGTMVGNMMAAMLNYGLTNHLNILATAPYIATHATAGTSSGFSGIQDINLALKCKALTIKGIDLIGILGASAPLSNYVAHHPFAIGTQSKTIFGRGMVHFQHTKGWAAAAYASYIFRSNITIDAENYFTDKNINSNEVAVPNIFQWGARAGFYTHRFAAESLFEHSAAQSGFDIRRNDIMFPAANQQIATRIGVFLSYRIAYLHDLQVVFQAMQTISGRNVGKMLSVGAGLMYVLDFNKKQ